MATTSCYSITTTRFTLRSGHEDWIRQTQKLYNEVLEFYYHLYLDLLPEERNSQRALRQLEKLTIVGRDKQPVMYPLPWEKLPLYFRRAAANGAIAAGKSFLERETQQERSQKFNESVTFYKGMYRDFTNASVSLKVWNGTDWCWLHCRLSGNQIAKSGQIMSPCVVLRKDHMELHVPVKTEVEDGRSAKERIAAGEKICSVVFTNQDAAAVCCILDQDGKQKSSFYIKGGSMYAHRCEQIQQKIERSYASTGKTNDRYANQKYWTRLRNLHDYYGHWFSRQIIDYCLAQEVKLLVLPKFASPYQDYLMASAGCRSPLQLSIQIRENVKYKAWQNGIIVLEAEQHHISSFCSICGAKGKRKGRVFHCEAGHRPDAYLNMARNLGNRCRESFGKHMN